MTHRDVLEAARVVWLDAALRDQQQFPGERGTTALPLCAGLIVSGWGPDVDRHPIWRLQFSCPDHSDHFFDVTHFNNEAHLWDWLTLARKLGEGPYVLLNPEQYVQGVP